eukprot:1954772-Amphidinium_carterae.1
MSKYDAVFSFSGSFYFAKRASCHGHDALFVYDSGTSQALRLEPQSAQYHGVTSCVLHRHVGVGTWGVTL